MNQSTARTRPPDLGALFMMAPTPFLVFTPDAPRFTILEANDPNLRAMGRGRDELIGRVMFKAFPSNPEDPGNKSVKVLSASLGCALASRVSDALANLKYDIPQPEGGFERRYRTLTNTPALDENGEVVAILHHVEDVTHAAPLRMHEAERELKAERLAKELLVAHEKLASSEGRLRALFEQAAVGMTVADLTGRWTQVNRRMAEMLGHDDPGELVGTSFAELINPEDREGDPELLRALDAGESPTYRRKKRYVRRDGRTIWAAVTVAVVRDAEGQPLYRVAVAEDIGERVAAEARRSFIARLTERLRDLADPVAILETATAMLGERLNVAQVSFGELDESHERPTVERDWTGGRAP